MAEPRHKVWLVGAGPGSADLLTLRAARLLASADIVFHDALIHPDTLALATRAELVAVGKRCGKHSTAQRFINKRLVDAAEKHANVVRLKGGDPMLFGRAQEEIDALVAAGIDVEVVPGVTAALAASAQTGVSLTRRAVSRSVVFATPRVGAAEAGSDWMAAVVAADTAVLYMAGGEAAQIAAQLMARGLSAELPVAIVQGASWDATPTAHTTLHAMSEHGVEMQGELPVLLILGEVYREALDASLATAQASAADIAARCRQA